ncbi:MAG: hypothetical protein OEV76_01415 [Anaerolineae bacterium]|nr:hypothetical protein [Anaerolineae bacterium]
MNQLPSEYTFPATQQYTYPNAASAAPMSNMATKATLNQQSDLALLVF